MNNNVDRNLKVLSHLLKELISKNAVDMDYIEKLLQGRPFNSFKVSQNALDFCIEKNILPYDYFLLLKSDFIKKYKDNDGIKAIVTDYNVPNEAIIQKMNELHKKYPTTNVLKYRDILNEQSLDLITLEEK